MTIPSQAQHAQMHALWAVAGVTSRDDRLALTSKFVGRPLATSIELSRREAERLITYMRHLDEDGLLAERCTTWLANHHKRSA